MATVFHMDVNVQQYLFQKVLFSLCILKLLWTAVNGNNANILTGWDAIVPPSSPFLQLSTPYGKIYFVTQHEILVCNQYNYVPNSPYTFYVSSYGSDYSIYSIPSQSPVFDGTPSSVQKCYNYTRIGSFDNGSTGIDAMENNTKGIRLMSFVGLDKRRYWIRNHNRTSISEGVTIPFAMADYLDVLFSLNKQIFALTFSSGGRFLTYVENCTKSIFLIISLPNGKVAALSQFMIEDDLVLRDKKNVTLPYIAFNHVDGFQYEIHFPRNENGSYRGSYNPTILKTNLAQRNRCVANELLSLDGPDRKRYSIDFERGKLSNTGTIPEDNSIALTFRVANDMIFEIKFSLHHDENEEVELDTRFGESVRPQKPGDDTGIDLKCLTSCVG